MTGPRPGRTPYPGRISVGSGPGHTGWGEVPVGHEAHPAPGRRRGLGLAVAIPLLAVHAMIVMGTLMMLGFAAMGLDPCGYRACGDPRWADLALTIVVVSAVALPVADLTVVILQWARRRAAWPVPLAFCALHLIVGAVCFALMLASGPQ